jgi:type I restriction enzyme S subunit
VTGAWQLLGSAAPAAGWETQRIGDLVELTNGFAFDSDRFGPDGSMPLVRIRDLFLEEFTTYLSGPVPDHVVLRDGDIVIGMDGDFELTVWRRGPAALNQRMCLLRPRPGVDARFVAYAMTRHLRVVNDLTYATTVKHLSSFDILSERILCPPDDGQRSIADYLDAETARIDTLVEARRRMLRLLDQRLDGYMTLTLDRHDWPSVPLKWKTRVTVGIVIRPAELYAETGVPCLRGVNVEPGAITDSDLVFISPEANIANAKSILGEGDVVVVRTGNAGAAAVVPTWAAGANCVDLLIVKHAATIDPRFLEVVLNSAAIRRQIEEKSVGALQAHFNTESLAALRVPIPDREQQTEVLAGIDAARAQADAMRIALARQIGLLVERRQALITAAVTGQLNIPGIAA